MPSNTIQLDALVLNGTPIPLSGETGGVRADVTFEDPTVITQGKAGNIRNDVSNKSGTMVITVLPEDDAHAILWNLYNTYQAARGANPIVGTFRRASTGLVLSFRNGAITSLPNMRSEATSSAASFTISFDSWVVA